MNQGVNDFVSDMNDKSQENLDKSKESLAQAMAVIESFKPKKAKKITVKVEA